MLELVQELAEVKEHLAKAEEQLRRNSRNSSQPPSQDKPEQKAVEAEQCRTKRQRGGQIGHAGHRRPLLPVDAVTKVVEHRPIHCTQCGPCCSATMSSRTGIK